MMSEGYFGRFFASLPLGLFVACMLAAAGGSASALTLGSLAPPNLGNCNTCEAMQRRSAPGQPSYRVPRGEWMITSWSAQGGGTADGRAQLRVYRPTGTKGQFKLVRQSAFEMIPANGHPKFPTRLKVRGGDLLGC